MRKYANKCIIEAYGTADEDNVGIIVVRRYVKAVMIVVYFLYHAISLGSFPKFVAHTTCTI